MSVIGLTILGVIATSGAPTQSIHNLLSSKRHAPDIEGLIHDNEYERNTGRVTGNGVYQYDHLVTVHKETRLALKSGESAHWSVASDHTNNEYVKIGEGEEVYHTFAEVGAFYVRALRDSDGMEFTFTMNARITRSEIRDLSEKDRNKYFETIHQYYVTGDVSIF